MIAMQYMIRLAGDYDLDLLRERVARRKPLFDNVEGLVHKAYLFNAEQAIYAPFYVWQSDDAARGYLTSDLFGDLVETFGRPRVRCWGVLACDGNPKAGEPQLAIKETDTIAAEDSLSELCRVEVARNREAMNDAGACFHLTGIDPDRWELMRYSIWCDASHVQNCDSDAVESFDILQVCKTG